MKRPYIDDFTIIDKLTGIEFKNETEFNYQMQKYFKDKKIILHLCADLGSDSLFYQLDKIKCDADMRSMCSQGFAKAFYESNK